MYILQQHNCWGAPFHQPPVGFKHISLLGDTFNEEPAPTLQSPAPLAAWPPASPSRLFLEDWSENIS